MDHETAVKLGSAFGGGMGLMGETCGVVTGAFMILGLRLGKADAGDKASKARIHQLAKDFAEDFRSRNGSLLCRELLGFDIDSREKVPDSGKIISAKCPGFIRDSLEILGLILEEQEKEQIKKGAE